MSGKMEFLRAIRKLPAFAEYQDAIRVWNYMHESHESVVETRNILADADTMEAIGEALRDG